MLLKFFMRGEMQVISLSSLIEASAMGGDINGYLSSFVCEKNDDVESFLHNKAIESEKRSFCRTSLVIDEEKQGEIIGYFTIMTKIFNFSDVSGTAKGRLTGNKRATNFNTILIAQLGRSDLYKGIIDGSQILNLALGNCQLIHNLSALRVVCVEYANNLKLIDFYKQNGFTELQRNEKGYIMSYVRL